MGGVGWVVVWGEWGGGSRTGFDVSFLFMNIKGGVRYLFNVFLAFKASYFIELTFPSTRSGGNIS